MLKFAVIGCGNRIRGIVKLLRATKKAELVAIMDIRNEEIREELGEEYAHVRYYDDAEVMLKTEALDGVCIGTRCSLHTHYAVLVAKYGIPLFLEKPVCTTYEDLARLEALPKDYGKKVLVSFPLRLSRMVTYVKEVIDSGKIGKVAQVQAYNNVPYARGYYHKWYRDDGETGGLFLQKATHDLDYINYLLGELRPVQICAMESKQVFRGDMPALQRCADCPKADICPEAPETLRKNGVTDPLGEYCAFACDTGNQDSGSVLVAYDNGMHTVYTQNFISRFSAGKRGARLIGFYGTVEFDWYTATVTVHHHMENITETHQFNGKNGGHFGGDLLLADNFIAVMEGSAPSLAPLEQGILSAKMCLAARKSATEGVFVSI